MAKNDNSRSTELLKETTSDRDIALCHILGTAIRDTNHAYSTFLQEAIALLCAPVVGNPPSEDEYNQYKKEYEDTRIEFFASRERQVSLPPTQESVRNLRQALPYFRGAIIYLAKCRFTGSQLKSFLDTIDENMEALAVEDMLRYMEYAVQFLPENKNQVTTKSTSEVGLMETLDKVFGEMKL